MSILATIAATDLHTNLQVLSNLVTVMPAADSDVLGWLDTKSTETRDTAVNLGKTLLVLLLVAAVWRSRGALAAGITAAASIAILWFVVGNIEGLSNRVENEVNGMRATTSSTPVAGDQTVTASTITLGPLSSAR